MHSPPADHDAPAFRVASPLFPEPSLNMNASRSANSSEGISLPLPVQSGAGRLGAASHPLATFDAHSPLESVRALYIHVPFCSHKCHYCDFYSFVDTQDRQQAFVLRLVRELKALSLFSDRAPIDSIFVGGGTPSLLRVDLWRALLATLHERFDLSLLADGRAEFTVECNPESVTPELLSVLRSGGVNRLSMGAQSFHSRHLQTLERLHRPAAVRTALDMARDAGIHRRSIDLIFGIPGQTLDDWKADLDAALALETEHLSCYNLTYEPNTAMFARLKRREFEPADEDLEVEMYDLTLDHLAAAGLRRYEVSNYARPGAECRHNLNYWRQGQWLSAGPSASGHVAGWRFKNVPRLDDYLEQSSNAADPRLRDLSTVVDPEPPDPRRLLRESLWTGLRLTDGLDAAALLAAFPDAAARQRCQSLSATLEAEGLLQREPAAWRLTRAGMLQADAVAVRFMDAVDGE